MSDPGVEALRAAITAGPDLFPLEASPDASAICFVSLTEREYRDASFLDRRMLRPESRTGIVPRSLLGPCVERLPRACDFLFHVSHAGSTLLSRLLGSDDRIFSLREPAILRDLARGGAAGDQGMLDLVLALLSRTFRPGQRAVVKATSIVNRIATTLMDRAGDARALLMTVPAETFLAAVLDGSPGDITAHTAERLDRLASFGVAEGMAADALGVGEAAAMSWLCENLAIAAVAHRAPDRACWLDFDRFLEAPADQLAVAFAAFGLDADVGAILAGDHMRRYAKRPDVAYDAAFRRRLLLDARRRLGAEIDAGLAWLDAVGARDRLAGTPVRVAAGDGH